MKWSCILLLLFTGGVMLISCKKPTLGNNATVPANSLGVVFTDSLTVKTYTVLEDSLQGSNQTINILGTINDPIFGNTYASIYSQFTLPIDDLILGTLPITVDSTILCLVYAGNYGKNSTPLNIKVYRIGEVFYVDSTYSTLRTFSIIPTLVGSLSNYIPNLVDSIHLAGNKLDYDTIAHAPEMRIKLSNALVGQFIANATTSGGGANVVDNPTFQNYFNGLYITTDTTKPGNNMVYFNMGSADSHLSIYYRSSSNMNPNVDTVVYFYSNSLAAIVQNFKHNYKGSTVAKFLGSTNPKGDSVCFVQAMSGVKTKFTVPYLKKLGPIAINKAEIVFTAISDSNIFPNPPMITINTLNSIGQDTSLADQEINSSYFGGFETSGITTYNSNPQYGIDLNLYYQNIVQGGIDSGLYAFPFPPNRLSNRVEFGGGTCSPKYRVRLNLTYTKLR